MLRTVAATRYVTPLREGGSLPAVVEADDDGMYVVKFRGAGQGVKALIAEIVCGEIARALSLTVPDIVLVTIDPALGGAEPDPEIHELLAASVGVNVGLDFLPGALPYTPAAGPDPDPDYAADVVWFDGLVTNVDRTPRNPNLLRWHGRVWLIDHGAALYLQHAGLDPATHADRPFAPIAEHVLLGCAGAITDADARLSTRVGRALIEAAVAKVPADWLDAAAKETYVDYLDRRCRGARDWVATAEAARGGRGPRLHAGREHTVRPAPGERR